MKRIIALGALAAGAATLMAGVAFAAAGATNGSFEQGTYSASNFQFAQLNAGSSAISGWTINSGSVDIIKAYWPPSDGAHSIDLDGTTPGSISQNLTTVVGATYTVTFDLAGNPAGGPFGYPAVKTVQVSATGATPQSFSFDTTGKTLQNMGWAPEVYSFLATSTTTTLTFASLSGLIQGFAAFGPALDNVVVSETLPTADMCKKDGWKSMIDSSGSTFKNQGDCVSFFATDGKNTGAGG